MYDDNINIMYTNKVLFHEDRRTRALGSISQRVRNLGLVLRRYTKRMASPKLGRVTRPNSR